MAQPLEPPKFNVAATPGVLNDDPEPVDLEEIIDEIEADEPGFTPELSEHASSKEQPAFLRALGPGQEQNITQKLIELLEENGRKYSKELGERIANEFQISVENVMQLFHWVVPAARIPQDQMSNFDPQMMDLPEAEFESDILAPRPMVTQKSLDSEENLAGSCLPEIIEPGDADEPDFTVSPSSFDNMSDGDPDEPNFVPPGDDLLPPSMTKVRTGVSVGDEDSDGHPEHIESDSDEPTFDNNKPTIPSPGQLSRAHTVEDGDLKKDLKKEEIVAPAPVLS